MDRVVNYRRPHVEKQQKTNLSKTSKIFFTLNIIQVVIVGSIQSVMMSVGDYSDISDEGMGPGRRVYMALFTGAVLYSCFLCLFAVKTENFLEVLAFITQNVGYTVYSFIQVYHINYKTYHNIKFHTPKSLSVLSIANCVSLIVLNTGFTYLAFKLFIEYGWKIYKRVRFDLKLRSAYHLYELVICLMKMSVLFTTMFSICLNITILRDLSTHPTYILTMSAIPLYIVTCVIAVIGIHRENKVIMYIVISIFIIGQGGLIYMLYRIGTYTCPGCQDILKELVDIPEELIMHLVYLASVALIFIILLTLATIKATLNFKMGLKNHFDGIAKNSTVLIMGLSRDIVSTIFLNTSFTKNNSNTFDREPDVSRDQENFPSNMMGREHDLHTLSPKKKNKLVETMNNNTDNILKNDVVSTSSNIQDETSNVSHQYCNGTFEDPNTVIIDDYPKFESTAQKESKSSTIPARIPTEQRSSVIERLSKQAVERLNKLYLIPTDSKGSNSVETSFGCCFHKKRRASDVYLPPFYLPNVSENNILKDDPIDNNIPDVDPNWYIDESIDYEFEFHNKFFHSLANDIILEEDEEEVEDKEERSIIETSINNSESRKDNTKNCELSRRMSDDLFIPVSNHHSSDFNNGRHGCDDDSINGFSFRPLIRTKSDQSHVSSSASDLDVNLQRKGSCSSLIQVSKSSTSSSFTEDRKRTSSGLKTISEHFP